MHFSFSVSLSVSLPLTLAGIVLFSRKIICCAFKQSLDMKYRFYNIFMAQKFIENNDYYESRAKWNTKILFANWATDYYRNPLYIFGNNVCTPNSPDFKMPNYLNMNEERPKRERKSQRVQLHGKLCRIYAFTPVFDTARMEMSIVESSAHKYAGKWHFDVIEFDWAIHVRCTHTLSRTHTHS